MDDAVEGLPESYCKPGQAIVAARRLSQAVAAETLEGEPVEVADPVFRHYLIQSLGYLREEAVLVLFFTAQRLYLGQDYFPGGGLAGCRVPFRQVVRRAFDLDARRLVLAHNHPSGEATPSQADIATTLHLRSLLDSLEIQLDDHVVVAGARVHSMRDHALL